MNRASAPVAPSSQSTPSKYFSYLDWSWPPSVSPNTLNHGFQVYLCVHWISASKSIPEVVGSRSPNASPNSLHADFDASLCIHLISVSKCISKLAHSRPPGASLCSLVLGVQMHLQIRSIPASKCISEFTRSQSLSASRNTLDHSIQVHPSGATTGVRRYRGKGGAQSDGEYMDIISFPYHRIIQRKYSLYLSQLLLWLTQSKILWILNSG